MRVDLIFRWGLHKIQNFQQKYPYQVYSRIEQIYYDYENHPSQYENKQWQYDNRGHTPLG